MVITNISYRKNFSISQFIFEHIGLDAQLEPHENPAEVLAQLKKQVEELHRQNNPQLWAEEENLHPLQKAFRGLQEAAGISPDPNKMTGMTIDEYPKTLAEQIRSCKELKVLESYKLLIKKDEEAKVAYLDMLEKLSNVKEESI